MSFDYDTLPTGYYDQVYRKKSGAQSRWHHAKFAHFARAMPGAGRHLDIGCGPGTFIGTLAGGAFDSTGVDIAQAQIDYATENYGGPGRTFTTVATGALPFEDDTFDVVSMIELIEHLPHARNIELLRDALRVTRPGGRILVSTPNYGGCWPWIEKLVNRMGGVDYTDQHITV
jgi:2-polyprenyl-3-methyl-5-hydroxy-6-metoxy-1,4-benzoquinol methylase